MSCSHEHHDDHNHDQSHPSTHPPHAPHLPTTPAHSLHQHIAHPQVSALNLAPPASALPLIFKDHSHRFDLSPSVSSDDSAPLLIHIPLTAPCKLFSLLIRSSPTVENCPHSIRLFANSPHLSLGDAAQTKPTYACEHIPAPEHVEHHLPRRLFSNVTHLTVFIANTYQDDSTLLYCIELRGQASLPLNRAPAKILYEVVPRREDHPVDNQVLNNFTV